MSKLTIARAFWHYTPTSLKVVLLVMATSFFCLLIYGLYVYAYHKGYEKAYEEATKILMEDQPSQSSFTL